jgi:hypothetical protein
LSLALSCFMYMFLHLWWCVDDLVRVLDCRALPCAHVAFASWCKRQHDSFVSGNWLVGGSGCNLSFKWKARVSVSLESLNMIIFFLGVLILLMS